MPDGFACLGKQLKRNLAASDQREGITHAREIERARCDFWICWPELLRKWCLSRSSTGAVREFPLRIPDSFSACAPAMALS
jgi:hypothetical protein